MHLEVIAGDKAEPNLGLDHQTWQRLADTVDLIVDPAALVHSVNGFRPDETAVYFESQTQFGDIPWPRDGSAGVFLYSA
jgi:male sterility protein